MMRWRYGLEQEQKKTLNHHRKIARLIVGEHFPTLPTYFQNRPNRVNRIRLALITALQILCIPFVFMFAYGVSSFLLFGREITFDFLTPEMIIPFSLAAVTLFAATLWNFDALHGRQWAYCVAAFNKIYDERTKRKHLILAVGLACDLMDTRLWAHKTFCAKFRSTLKLAVLHHDKKFGTKFAVKLENDELHFDEADLALTEFWVHLTNKPARKQKTKKSRGIRTRQPAVRTPDSEKSAVPLVSFRS